MGGIIVEIHRELHHDPSIVQVDRLMVLLVLCNFADGDIVSDRLEAVLARTDDLDAANIAHFAQSISEMRGKSHGLHGIHPGMLANEISRPGSSHSHSPTQPGRTQVFSLMQILFISQLLRCLEREKQRRILKYA